MSVTRIIYRRMKECQRTEKQTEGRRYGLLYGANVLVTECHIIGKTLLDSAQIQF